METTTMQRPKKTLIGAMDRTAARHVDKLNNYIDHLLSTPQELSEEKIRELWKGFLRGVQGFRPSDDDKLEWMLRKMKQLSPPKEQTDSDHKNVDAGELIDFAIWIIRNQKALILGNLNDLADEYINQLQQVNPNHKGGHKSKIIDDLLKEIDPKSLEATAVEMLKEAHRTDTEALERASADDWRYDNVNLDWEQHTTGIDEIPRATTAQLIEQYKEK